MGFAKGVERSLSATDPGRSRLKLAAAVATGMLLSALGAWAIVSFLHADPALLTIGIFLAMQTGLVSKDATPKARFVTTALLFFPIAVSATVATLLSPWRPLEIAVFVGVAGVCTWVRRFGPRASAFGFAAFFGYFFALLLDLSLAQLPFFVLVAASTVAAQSLMRALLLFERPRRQIELLLRELRSASLAALAAAADPDPRHPQTLRNRLARVDAVGRAVSDWQQEFDTARYMSCDETTLASRVLDARIDTEQACAELARECLSGEDQAAPVDADIMAAVRDLRVILDDHAATLDADAAAERASTLLASLGPETEYRPVLGRLARSSLAQQALREIEFTRTDRAPVVSKAHRHGASMPLQPDAQFAPSAAAAAVVDKAAASPDTFAPDPADADDAQGSFTKLRDWRNWNPSTRLAIQVMVAAAVATIAGDAISASRWYWAVLTAFVVFVGTTTRGGILTRAYGRVMGTVVGLFVGGGLVLLAHDQKPLLVAICVVAAFGMMYLGPIRYLYSAFCMSVMLVSMYGLLGDLDTQILELRIDETVTGAVIGVLCAYLIFSANSRPALTAKIDAYFSAFDGVLSAGRNALTAPGGSAEVLAAVRQLDAALIDVDKFAAGMSVAFIGPRHSRRGPFVHLFYLGARTSERFALSALAVTMSDPVRVCDGDAASALDDALDHVRGNAVKARASLDAAVDNIESDDSAILGLLARIPFDALSPQASALLDLSRINWVMRHIAMESNTR